MREIHREIVCAILRSQDGKVLLGRKAKRSGAVYSDCWHIPGGGIEDGENQVDALRREVQEEVGLNICKATVSLLRDSEKGDSIKRLPTGEEVVCHMKFFEYLVLLPETAAAIATKPSPELTEIRWFGEEELASIKLVPASVGLFKQFRAQIFRSNNKPDNLDSSLE